MLNWAESYTCSWRLAKVDETTWADSGAILGINSAKITRTADGHLLESGSISIDSDELDAGYYRLVLVARSESGEYERVEVATMLFEGDSCEYDYGGYDRAYSGRSVLFPASKRVFIDGTYAPANTDGAEFAAKLLAMCVKAPIEVETSFTLNNNIVFEFGSSCT